MHYLNQVHSTSECIVSEKQADFIYKYNVFTLCLSLITNFSFVVWNYYINVL